MRSYRSDYHRLALRSDYRTSYAQRISGRSRWRSDNQAVSLVGVEVLAVDIGLDADHRRTVMLEHGYLVQGAGVNLQRIGGGEL